MVKPRLVDSSRFDDAIAIDVRGGTGAGKAGEVAASDDIVKRTCASTVNVKCGVATCDLI